MATSNYTKRAQDSLDLLVVSDVFLAKVKKACKAAVAHSISQKVEALTSAKRALDSQLKQLGGMGFFAKLAQHKTIRAIKKRIAEVNTALVDWINSTYRYFFTPSL
jgi:small-conductance mechanosensitive channel